tara:strand:+ start:3484 stop:3882 length:399 start_codon:yes stop_codon:yes gene_type:complete
MAHIYDTFRQFLANGSVNLATQTIGITLVNTTLYTFNAAHDHLNDIPVAARIASTSLTNVQVSSGRLDADNITLTVAANSSINGVVLFVSTANSSTSPLMFIQSEGATFPVNPDGGQINITFPSSDPFILKI